MVEGKAGHGGGEPRPSVPAGSAVCSPHAPLPSGESEASSCLFLPGDRKPATCYDDHQNPVAVAEIKLASIMAGRDIVLVTCDGFIDAMKICILPDVSWVKR